MQVERIEGCDSKQADILSRIGTLIAEVRQKIESQKIERQCFLKVMALSLMAEKVDGRKASVNEIEFPRIQLSTEYPSQIEKCLWTLFMGREIAGDHSVNSDKLVDYFNSLVACKSPFLGMMLWLFPELVTEDRITTVANIERECLGTWMLRDRMLFWLACINDSNCRPERTRYIEAEIRRLQLDSGVDAGAFATVEGKDEKGNLISSAIGLLVLVSCAREDDSEDPSTVEAAQKTARWILDHLTVPQIVDASSAWALYALSEYTTFLNWLELNRARSMVIER